MILEAGLQLRGVTLCRLGRVRYANAPSFWPPSATLGSEESEGYALFILLCTIFMQLALYALFIANSY
jgi:hypothetical protein